MKRSIVAAILLVGLVSGCSSSQLLRLQGPSAASTIDESATVSINGLRPHQLVVATVTSTDAHEVPWRAYATVRADSRGRAQLNAAALIATMTPEGRHPDGAYFWQSATGSRPFRISVSKVSVTVLRRLSTTPVRRTSVRAHGLVGTYYTSTRSRGCHCAVLLLGGSEGGQLSPLLPTLLAGKGVSVLTLAYFKSPGLPRELSRVPLEYFARGLRWLGRQPGVNPQRVVVEGASRGGEAALLVGATFGSLVHAVIAGVPSDVSLCSYPGCKGAAWTLHGSPLPFTREFDVPNPIDNPGAIIPVDRIAGPVLLNCAGRDQVWDSCGYARAIMSRLAPDRRAQLQRCPLCDHYAGLGVPGEPYAHSGPYGISLADIRAFPRFFRASLRLIFGMR